MSMRVIHVVAYTVVFFIALMLLCYCIMISLFTHSTLMNTWVSFNFVSCEQAAIFLYIMFYNIYLFGGICA